MTVLGLIFSKDNKLFLIKRKDENLWELPGGETNENDDLFDTLKMKTLETTAIDIAWYDIELVDKKTLAGKMYCAYKITLEDQDADRIEIRLSDSISQYLWLDQESLDTEAFTNETAAIFKDLKYL